jgi:hypothetical protein
VGRQLRLGRGPAVRKKRATAFARTIASTATSTIDAARRRFATCAK